VTEPIDDEPFIRFVADNKSVAIVAGKLEPYGNGDGDPETHLICVFRSGCAAGLELIRDAMYYRFGQIFGQRVRPLSVFSAISDSRPYLTRH
jgi:hypothetical protein